ncbi:hypothetical protein BU24DRAFT_405146 [Aaosphaeria arxii CBS 175.79]|uniref:Coenzyme Q-binding protein COQ10 START domain-containing protein n=1 Tax=Aaosphaeria arxii CBS 175.79 TaxID=1450172 RepID=A0A6A5Y9J8_9PLEO|nr:uncharacterized protein BU24DRAFT_405146 [Aaosphaeria arxii CBS 175.79]KAF2022265.1 hypothetical protein BU24DRAFT_405146 [Aaosphaeria arxii CBS 175.79]
MFWIKWGLTVPLLFSLLDGGQCQTNLPDVPPGVFTASARIVIYNTTTAAAWEALTNFPKYPDWNPFVRSSIVVSPWNITLPEQRPVEGKRLFLRTQIPPLPLPVNRYTPDNPLNIAFAYENVTHIQPELGRLAWDYQAAPDEALSAERWQAISDIGEGRVLYEAREVFHGSLAPVLKALQGEGLQKSFEGQAAGLKLYLESQS